MSTQLLRQLLHLFVCRPFLHFCQMHSLRCMRSHDFYAENMIIDTINNSKVKPKFERLPWWLPRSVPQCPFVERGKWLWGEIFKRRHSVVMIPFCLHLFGNFVCFSAYFVTATFDDDRKGYIQKSLADSLKLRTERILFCHPCPSSMPSISGVNQVGPLAKQFNLCFFSHFSGVHFRQFRHWNESYNIP